MFYLTVSVGNQFVF